MGIIVLIFSFMLGAILALIWSAIEAGHKTKLERRRMEKIKNLTELLSGVYYDRGEVDSMMQSMRDEYRFIMDDISVTVNSMVVDALSQCCDKDQLERLSRCVTSLLEAYSERFKELNSRMNEIPQYVKTTVDSATSDFCVRKEMTDYIFRDYRGDMAKVREYVINSVAEMRGEYDTLRSQIDHMPEVMKSMTDYAAAGFCARDDLKTLSGRTDAIEKRLSLMSWTYEKFGGFSELQPRLQEAETLLSRIEKRSSKLNVLERRLSHFQAFYDMMELDGLWAPFKSVPADDDQFYVTNR